MMCHQFIEWIKHVALNRKYEMRGCWYKYNVTLDGKMQILEFHNVESKNPKP